MNRFLHALSTILRPSREAETPPDSTEIWRVWMASESVPTLVAAMDLGVFAALRAGALSESTLRVRLRASDRATKVLLWHLGSLGLLQTCSAGKTFSLAPVSRRYLTPDAADRRWKKRIASWAAHVVTPESYLREATDDEPRRFRFHESVEAAKDDLPLRAVSRDRLALPAVAAAVRLGIAKLLGDRPVPIESVTSTLGISSAYAMEILSYLSAAGLAHRRGGRWSLGATGRAYLLADDQHPHHWGGIFELMTRNPALPKSLTEAIRGEKTGEIADGDDAMMAHVMSPALARVFAKHMHSQGATAAVAIARHPIFRRSQRVLDVAGGGGTYALEIAKHNPHLSLCVMELDPIVRVTREWTRVRRAGSRVTTWTGNMFLASDWPRERFDTIFFSHVMHDWGLPKIGRLLKIAFDALPPGGRVVLHEILVGRGGRRREIATAFSVTLFKWTEGRQYRAGELMEALRRAGFSVSSEDIQPAHGPSSLVIATKPAR